MVVLIACAGSGLPAAEATPQTTATSSGASPRAAANAWPATAPE